MHDPSLNVGVGAGGLFMLITCQKEMRKLNKTEGETENLIEELKQQLELNCEEIESHRVDSSDNTSCPSQSSFHTSCHGQSSHGVIEQPVSPKACKKDDFLDGHVSLTHGNAKDQMATLAAELEAELELMELNITTEESRPFETCMHDGDEVSKGISNSYYSDTSSHGMLEASDIGRPSAQSHASCNFSVSPIELDHRLRKLLEAQQQERILELEELLEETKTRLLVKEHEVLCWKNHVNSLTNLLQLHSSDAYVHRPQKLNDKDSVTLHDNHGSEVNKNVDQFLQLFQDPTVSKQLHDVNVALSTESVHDVCIQKTASSHRSSDSDSFNVKHMPNRTSISASRKTRDVTKGAAHSNFQEGFEGTGIDIPENAILKAMDTQTVGQNAEGYQNQVLVVDTDIGDICLAPEISRLPVLKREFNVKRGHAHDNEAVSAGNVAEIPESHPANCRLDVCKPTVCPKEELDQDTDVKYIVNSVMTRPLLLSKYQENSFEEAIQEPKVRMPSVTAKKCWGETHGTSVGVTSPVLDKIRHYEALGARVMEKRV